MKRNVILILAGVFLFPLFARPQNEGVKPVANPVPVKQEAMQNRTTREMAMIQEQTTGGGAPMPSGIASENSPLYLEPGWMPGKVYLKDKSEMDFPMLRYDIYHQQIQFIKDRDTLAFSNPEEISMIMLGNRKMIYTDFDRNGVMAKSYFELLAEGDCRLLMHRTIKYHIDEESADNLKDEIYIRECEYFIERNDETAKQIRNCRKGVLCAFKDKEEEIDSYMKEQDLKMNTCEDLKQVVDYYNSLK